MHMFNRGFNGKQVGITAGPRVGPVAMQPSGASPVVSPAMTGGFTPAPAAPKAIQGPAPAQMQAAAPAPTAPGAIPMGKKANCPVCRSFGG